MVIRFKSNALQKTLNSEERLRKKYGADNAGKIMRRMAVLQAAANLGEVSREKPERRHELKGRKKGQFAVDILHPFRIVFEPAHNPVPRKEDGGIDLTSITAIRILDVEDYH